MPCRTWLLAATVLVLSCGGQVPARVGSATPRSNGVGDGGGGASIGGVGYGANAHEARRSALASLSEAIIATVNSTLTRRSHQGGGRNEDVVDHQLRVSSETLLKGVQYTEPRPTRDGLRVDARLTAAAAEETIGFLLREIGQNAEVLGEKELRRLVQRVGLLEALLATSLASRLPNHQRNLAATAAARTRLNQHLNMGVVEFNGDLTGASLTLDGATIPPQARHFAAPGAHVFSVVRRGYRQLDGRFRIAAGERKLIELPQVRDDNQVHRLYLNCGDAPPPVCDSFTARLSRLRIQPSPTTTAANALQLNVDDVFTEAAGHRKHRLEVTVRLWAGKRVAQTLSAKTSFHTTPSTETAIVRKRTERVLDQLVPVVVDRMLAPGVLSKGDINYDGMFRGRQR